MRIVWLILCIGVLFSDDRFTIIDEHIDHSRYELALEEINSLMTAYPQDAELLWRKASAHFEIADQTSDISIHKTHFYPGFESAKEAVELNPNSARAHHWYAVLIGKIGMLEGTEQKIINSYEVEKFALKAIELDPNYDGTYHVMGRWHYEISNLSWFERKIASWVYEAPPEGSYEKAVEFFIKAISVAPDDVRHHVWLGKTYIELDQEDSAKQEFEIAISLPAKDEGDVLLIDEATNLLDTL